MHHFILASALLLISSSAFTQGVKSLFPCIERSDRFILGLRGPVQSVTSMDIFYEENEEGTVSEVIIPGAIQTFNLSGNLASEIDTLAFEITDVHSVLTASFNDRGCLTLVTMEEIEIGTMKDSVVYDYAKASTMHYFFIDNLFQEKNSVASSTTVFLFNPPMMN